MERILKNTHVVAVGIALLILAAYAALPSKAYAVPAPPAGETAVLVSGPYTDIESVDGQAVRGLTVEVTAGTHTVVLKPNDQTSYREYIFYTWVTGSVTFTAQAGHKYLAYVDFVTSRAEPEESGTGFVWIGYIQDKTSGMKLAKTEELPLGAERREYPTGAFGPRM